MKASTNFCDDEKRILEAENTGMRFLAMNDKDLQTAANLICYRLSKTSGCLLPTHPDGDKQKKLLLDLFSMIGKFIKSNKRFKLLTTAEVLLASSWNAAGEFPEKVKHWQQELNLDYLGELLNQYCRHKARFGIKEKLEMETNKLLPQNTFHDPFFWEKEIETQYQLFLKGKFIPGLWQMGMYSKLADLCLIPHNMFVTYLEPAYQQVWEDLKAELSQTKSRGGNTNPIYDKARLIDEYKHSNKYVLYQAKRLCIKAYFNECYILKMRNLFEEEK